MNRLSTRYAPHMAALLVLVLIPVIVHSYADVRDDECAHPDVLANSNGVDEKRAGFLRYAFDADQWREGRLARDPGMPELRYSILRSWNPKRLYYRPAHRMYPTQKPVRHEVEWIEVSGVEVPIHREHYRDPASRVGARRLVAYLLMYEGEAVSNPYVSQVTAAPRQLFTGSRPMTLFFISATADSVQEEATENRLRDWLKGQYVTYHEICG